MLPLQNLARKELIITNQLVNETCKKIYGIYQFSEIN